MSDYISREEAIMAVTRAKLPDTTPDGVPIANGKRSVTDCVRRIKEIPAADVRPVVLCRDCKYSDTFVPDCTEATFPLKCLSIRYGGVYPNWFCEHGEKKEEI